MDDSASVTGLTIVKLLCVSSGIFAAVDDEIAVAAILLNGAVSVTATVRVFKSAACATELVVTPAANDTVHCT